MHRGIGIRVVASLRARRWEAYRSAGARPNNHPRPITHRPVPRPHLPPPLSCREFLVTTVEWWELYLVVGVQCGWRWFMGLFSKWLMAGVVVLGLGAEAPAMKMIAQPVGLPHTKADGQGNTWMIYHN